MSLTVGIDLGTTHSLVAVMTPDGPRVLADEQGRALIPSAVALDEGGRLLVGAAAAARLAHRPDSGHRWFKRDMGQEVEHPLGEERLGPVGLSALVLRELRVIAELALGRPVERAVITVPAYFQEPQRAATAEAARLAGLQVARMINEPTAAALAHGLHDARRERRVAVLDLGGGTFDVSLLEIFEGVIEVVGTGGDSRLGGEDFTEALFQFARAEAGLGEVDAPGPRALLREACERARCLLSEQTRVPLSLPVPGMPVWKTARTLELSRPMLEALAAPLLRRVEACVADTLSAARRRPEEIDEVLLVGGATRMPAIAELATRVFGRLPIQDHDPDRVVALGAAVQAALVDRDEAVAELVVTDVLGHSLGVEISREGEDRFLPGYFLPVLHRNTTLPARRVERLSTLHHRQRTLKVAVFQGEHRYTRLNRPLGSFEVRDIPPAASEEGRQAVDIAFTHDLNGLLEVEATIVETGAKASILIEQQAGRLSPEARERAVQALARLKVHPRELLPNRLLLEQAAAALARAEGHQAAILDAALLSFEDALERQHPEAVQAAAAVLRRLLG